MPAVVPSSGSEHAIDTESYFVFLDHLTVVLCIACWVGLVFSAGRITSLQNTLISAGCNIGFAGFHWKSSKFNRCFIRLQLLSPRFFRIWFSVGGLVGIMALCLGPLFLVHNLCISLPSLVSTVFQSRSSSTKNIEGRQYDIHGSSTGEDGVTGAVLVSCSTFAHPSMNTD